MIFRYINMFFFLCYVLEKLGFLIENKIVLFLYTSYFKVLSRNRFCFVVASNKQKGVHIFSWAVSKQLFFGESVVWNLCERVPWLWQQSYSSLSFSSTLAGPSTSRFYITLQMLSHVPCYFPPKFDSVYDSHEGEAGQALSPLPTNHWPVATQSACSSRNIGCTVEKAWSRADL